MSSGLLSILFSMGTLVATHGLGRRLFDAPTGRAAAFLLAISPSSVFFGRAFISDTPMVFFSVAALWGLATYARTHDRRAAWWGIGSAALACMVKIPAVLIFAPIAWLAWHDVRRETTPETWGARLGSHVQALLHPVWIAAIAIPFAGTALWYWHGDRIFHRTGLGQAIFHPSGGYAPDVAMAMGPVMGVSHWSTFHQLADPEFYSTLLDRTYYLHLTPVGFGLALFGLVICRARSASSVVLVWLAAVLLFIFASAEGNRYHEFHQLPMLPPMALLFGLAASPAFDASWLRRLTGSRLVPIASAICVTAVGYLGFSYSNVVYDFFRPDRLDVRSLSAGNAIEARVPPGRTIVVVEYPAVRRELADPALPSAPEGLELRLELNLAARRAAAAAAIRRVLLRDDDLVAPRRTASGPRRVPQDAAADPRRRARHGAFQVGLTRAFRREPIINPILLTGLTASSRWAR